ncbi:MAG: orotate phosphoribosyltransferase [Phycisphaerales bacterium]|nr:orotate phosphoribosyltransferase [Phycisphaerales bacterium]
MNDRELADALRAAAYLEGDFTLRSGRKSKYYLDKYLFETQPALLRELAIRFAKFAESGTTRIAGAELGGVALAAAASLQTNLPFVIVRNSKKADYGTGKLVEGRLESGDRVLLVEDIATTGGQALEAAKVLRSLGAMVTRCVAVIDRQEGARENFAAADIPFSSIFTTSDLGIAPTPK